MTETSFNLCDDEGATSSATNTRIHEFIDELAFTTFSDFAYEEREEGSTGDFVYIPFEDFKALFHSDSN